MVNVSIAGNQIGISFNEIMMLATAITFLFAIIPFTLRTENGIHPYNPLDVPGDTVNAFNTLWFNDFVFFSERGGSCRSTISGLSSFGNATMPSLNSTTATQTNSFFNAFGLGIGSFINSGIVGVYNLVISNPITKAIYEPIGGVVSVIYNVLYTFKGLLFDCGVGGFKLVAGFAILAYWGIWFSQFFGGIAMILTLFK